MTLADPRDRLVVIGLLLAHAALLALLLASGRAPIREQPATLMIATAISEPAVAPAVVLEPTVSTVATSVEPPEFAITEDIASAMPTPGASAGCAISDAVQAALAGSAAVGAALGHMPVAARSVSGATLLWDGRWAAADTVGAGVLPPIATVVVATIRAAPADCRDAPVIGPRLAFVSDAGGMRILAFGSGTWKWSQLLRDSPGTADKSPVVMTVSK